MNLIVDSHTLIWAVDQPAQLGSAAASASQDSGNGLLVSAATIRELAIKVGLGKLTLTKPYREWMTQALRTLMPSCFP